MDPSTLKPFWIDHLGRKHESGPYDESDTDALTIENGGESLQIMLPKFMNLVAVKVTASRGDLLFLLGEQLDTEDEDGYIIKAGDGLLMVARKHPRRVATYTLCVWHTLFPQSLRQLLGPGWAAASVDVSRPACPSRS